MTTNIYSLRPLEGYSYYKVFKVFIISCLIPFSGLLISPHNDSKTQI